MVFSYVLFPHTNNGIKFDSKLEEFFVGVVLAPFIETFLFQHIVIITLQKLKINLNLIVLICGAIFGLMHMYSVGYVLGAFITGVLYSLLYLIMQKKQCNPIVIVAICHSAFNLIAFIVNGF
jgi:hypothetical protein